MASQDSHPLKASPESATAQKVIRDLTKSEPDSPTFEPHITLYSPVPKGTPLESILDTLRHAVAQLSANDKRLELGLKPAQKGTFYFQSVLAPIEPTDGLLSLRKACVDAFGELKTYFPHLSLLYGDLTPERRDELAHSVNEGMELPTSVKITELLVVDCTGVVSEWKTVARVPLQ